jgi:hypothetical protein
MIHRFYSKTPKEQNRFQLFLGLVTLALIAAAVGLAIYTGIYLIAIFSFIITISIVAPFFDMPSIKKSGKMTYYSALFIAENPKNGVMTIHGGTLFDYYFVLDWQSSGRQRTNSIIQQYLEGLLSLIEEHATNKDLIVRGTSYILNPRTAEKLGFTLAKTDGLQYILLIYNYFNLMISNSMAKNKLAFPRLKNSKTFEAEVGQLLERKEYIESLNRSLKASIAREA